MESNHIAFAFLAYIDSISMAFNVRVLKNNGSLIVSVFVYGNSITGFFNIILVIEENKQDNKLNNMRYTARMELARNTILASLYFTCTYEEITCIMLASCTHSKLKNSLTPNLNTERYDTTKSTRANMDGFSLYLCIESWGKPVIEKLWCQTMPELSRMKSNCN